MDTRNTCLHQTGSLNLTSRQCGSFDFFFKRASKHLHTLPGLCNNRYTFNTASHVFQNGNSSLGRAINWKVTRNFAGSSPRCGKGFLSQGQLPVRTFLRCPYSPRVQSHASTSACTLKIPDTRSHTIVWTHENTVHTAIGMSSAAFVVAMP